MKMNDKCNRLMPNGIPRYIRCYDDGGISADRYTIVFTRQPGYLYLAMSEFPFHPAYGICQHGTGLNYPVDRPTYAHLGKKINFTALPNDCKRIVANEYCELWRISLPLEYYADPKSDPYQHYSEQTGLHHPECKCNQCFYGYTDPSEY